MDTWIENFENYKFLIYTKCVMFSARINPV